MNKDMVDDNLDLLDLEDDNDLSVLPETSPFTNPRPKKPWLLMGVGLLVIILTTYIIIRTIGSDSSSSVEIDLDTPEVVTVDSAIIKTTDAIVVPPAPAKVEAQKPAAKVVKPVQVVKPVSTASSIPVREVKDRKEVTFNPNAGTTKSTAAPIISKPKPLPSKPKAAISGSWYVQFGSYSTRAMAEVAKKKISAKHSSLFADKQFVILAAVLKNGKTTYRLRIAFANSRDANGFCRNAKSDGLDCYVAR